MDDKSETAETKIILIYDERTPEGGPFVHDDYRHLLSREGVDKWCLPQNIIDVSGREHGVTIRYRHSDNMVIRTERLPVGGNSVLFTCRYYVEIKGGAV